MCDSGYAALAGSNKCVRTCPVGADPTNPLYYEDGPVCWPFCLNGGHAFGADAGPSCVKTVSSRTENGNVPWTPNPAYTYAPQCPPNYTGYVAQNVSNFYTTVTPVYESGWQPGLDAGVGIYMYNCYENCASPLVNDSQGNCNLVCSDMLAGTNNLCCNTSVCGVNQGEAYVNSPIVYPSVKINFTGASTNATSVDVTGYVGNYGYAAVTDPLSVSTLKCGTCIRDPYSFYSAARTSSGFSYPDAQLEIVPTKIVRDVVYPTCGPNVISTDGALQYGSGLQQYSFYSDAGPLYVGSNPLDKKDSSYTVDGLLSQTPHGTNNGFFPTPSQFQGANTAGKYYNFQNLFYCQNTCANAGEVREGQNCMQSAGPLSANVGGLTYTDYSMNEWAVTFGVNNTIYDLIYPSNDEPNRRVMAGLSQTSDPGNSLGYDTSVMLPWTGSTPPAGTAPYSGGCTGGKVPARRWTSTSYEQIYRLRNTGSDLFPASTICIDPSVCPSIGSQNPFGFIEFPGGGGGNMQVFCGLHGSHGYADVCTDRGMADDPVYSNVCIRAARFQEPHTQFPNQCPNISDMYYRNSHSTGVDQRATTLYGHSALVVEKNDVTLPGYQGEAIPQTYRISPSQGLFTTGVNYSYNDVVASFKQNVLGSKSNEVVYYGPFYRCIQAITNSDATKAPPRTVPQTNVNTQEQYSVSDPAHPVSNAYWTDLNVPSEWRLVKARLAGDGGYLGSACAPAVGNSPQFCPPVCITQCPLGNTDVNDPNYQQGLYEPAYQSSVVDGAVVVNESSCYPVCGTSSLFQGSGPVCLLRAQNTHKVAGYSTCPNGTSPVVQINDGQDVYTAIDTGASGEVAHKTAITNSQYLTVTSGKCYDPCPDRTEIMPFNPNDKGQNALNFRQCRDVCPASESFYDGGTQCYKIAVQRSSPATSTSSSFLNNNLQTSANIAKFAYYGGVSTLWSIVAIVVAVGIFTALILLAKRRHWVKSTTYFVN